MFFVMSSVLAQDEHWSSYAVTPPLSVYNPGYGTELATTLGSRMVVGVAMEWSEPLVDDQRDIRLRTDARLLYSLNMDAYWYPIGSAQWTLQNNQWRSWLGLGFQREFTREFGFFADALWQPGTADFQTRLGLRIWLMRFQSLDSRVRSSRPVGATYDGAVRSSTPELVVETVQASAVTKGTVTKSTMNVKPKSGSSNKADLSLASGSTQSVESQTKPPISNANETSISPRVSTPALNAWYVHLGLFQHIESMSELVQSPALSAHQNNMITWFDDEKNLYRLMIGPLIKPKAQSIKLNLGEQNIDSFLYRRVE
jgi:cell division septation protein DedD